MRIGLVTGEYPPMQGGVGAFTRELARALAKQGHEVYIFTRVEAAEDSEPEPGIHVAGLVDSTWGWWTLAIIQDWAAYHDLDVVNIQFQTAAYDMRPAIHWLPSSLNTIPVVVTFHDLRFPYLFPKAGPLRTWIVRRLAHRADGVISTNRADEACLRDEWHIENVTWIPIGSNVSTTPPPDYDRQAWREKLGAGPGDLLLSYFGFLNESKGGLVLIETLARLVERGVPARLVMIGGRAGASDPTNMAYGEQVDALIEQHGLADRVRWTGFVDDPGVTASFLASDITALPYLDGVSLRRGTLIAALAHGRAIVTTDPQMPEPELDGVLVTAPPADADALADAIERLWQQPQRRHELEQAAHQAAAQFDWATIAQQTADFFSHLQA